MKVNTIIREKKQYEQYKSNINFSNQLNVNRDNKYKSSNHLKKKKIQNNEYKVLDKFDELNKIDHNFKQYNKNANKTLQIMNAIEKKI
jgi:hypothetical protein